MSWTPSSPLICFLVREPRGGTAANPRCALPLWDHAECKVSIYLYISPVMKWWPDPSFVVSWNKFCIHRISCLKYARTDKCPPAQSWHSFLPDRSHAWFPRQPQLPVRPHSRHGFRGRGQSGAGHTVKPSFIHDHWPVVACSCVYEAAHTGAKVTTCPVSSHLLLQFVFHFYLFFFLPCSFFQPYYEGADRHGEDLCGRAALCPPGEVTVDHFCPS